MLRLAADAGLLLMDVLAACRLPALLCFFYLMLFVFEEVKNHDVIKDPRVLSVLSTIFVCILCRYISSA